MPRQLKQIRIRSITTIAEMVVAPLHSQQRLEDADLLRVSAAWLSLGCTFSTFFFPDCDKKTEGPKAHVERSRVAMIVYRASNINAPVVSYNFSLHFFYFRTMEKAIIDRFPIRINIQGCSASIPRHTQFLINISKCMVTPQVPMNPKRFIQEQHLYRACLKAT